VGGLGCVLGHSSFDGVMLSLGSLNHLYALEGRVDQLPMVI
jgi:hypothetical protein